jgi:LPXTG-motif cell wall-anchored protein
MTVSERGIGSATGTQHPATSVNNNLLPQTGNTESHNGLLSGIATLGLSVLASVFAFGKKRRHED